MAKSCLKRLSLKIWVLNDSFTLPNELFSSEALNTINVSAANSMMTNLLRISSNPCIKCVFLRVLDLHFLSISEEVLSNLLSTCTLLEKINLWHCEGLKNVMVKNLRHLCELGIVSVEQNDLWEINNVPSLRSFSYRTIYGCWDDDPIPFKIDSLATLTQLSIDGVIIDNTFFDIIKSKCLLLESLTLGIRNWGLQSLVITSASLKSLTLDLWEYDRQVNVQVYAPKLLSFVYTGEAHGLFFPTIAPKKIKLTYYLKRPLDQSFFLKLGEVVNSSSKFDIYIKERNPEVPLNIDLDCLRRRGSFLVTNVHELWLKKSSDEHMEMMERRTIDLKDVQYKNPCNGKWETLTSSGVLDALTDLNSSIIRCQHSQSENKHEKINLSSNDPPMPSKSVKKWNGKRQRNKKQSLRSCRHSQTEKKHEKIKLSSIDPPMTSESVKEVNGKRKRNKKQAQSVEHGEDLAGKRIKV
ncbi:F-box protein-like protein [Tanacetum coccineum]